MASLKCSSCTALEGQLYDAQNSILCLERKNAALLKSDVSKSRPALKSPSNPSPSQPLPPRQKTNSWSEDAETAVRDDSGRDDFLKEIIGSQTELQADAHPDVDFWAAVPAIDIGAPLLDEKEMGGVASHEKVGDMILPISSPTHQDPPCSPTDCSSEDENMAVGDEWSCNDSAVEGDWDDSPPTSLASSEESLSCLKTSPAVVDPTDTVSSSLSLGIQSRLSDRSFYTPFPCPASYVRSSLETQVHCLGSAYRIAQQALWNMLGTHHPEIQQQSFPQGALQVAFEWNRLSGLLRE